ncbi:MAG: TIGR02147 family protein [Fibrobacter sp.]|nr:TIGR02147 family protein [Fibrobacter sp.]
MKPIFGYSDYRDYIRDYFEERKKHSAFSWREFNRLAGFASPNYLKLVCDGKSKLSKIRSSAVATVMNLSGSEQEFFELMVAIDNTTNEANRKALTLKLRKMARKSKPRIIDADAYVFYESWKYPVLRELAPLMPGASSKKIAEVCHEKICAEDVENTLQFLVQAGFLEKDKKGRYTQTDANVTGSKESLPRAIREMQRQMAALAEKAIGKFSKDERHFLGITCGCDEETYKKVTAELEDCRDRITAITSAAKNINQVFRINLQMFPLTKKV